MSNNLYLEQVSDESLDAILALNLDQKTKYFTELAKVYFPKIDTNSEQFIDLVETYISCFYVEKLYRCNRFFREKFTPVYTNKGLIRNLTADIYFTDESLLIH